MSRFEWIVALRYLRAKRKQTVISVITVISILGVAAGVAALLRRRGVQVTNLSMVSALGEDVLPKERWQALVRVDERESLCA